MTYLILYFFASILFTSFIFKLLLSSKQPMLNIYDHPNERKIHTKKILKIGGIVILFSSLFMLTLYRLLNDEDLFKMTMEETSLLMATIFLVIGALFDDIVGINAPKKLFFQVIAIIILINAGYIFELFNNRIVNIILTGCLFICIINSMNLIDGIDGLSSSIFVLFVLFAIIFSNKLLIVDPKYYVLFSIFLGSIGSFMFLNFPPAKIFLGDTGSQLLGWILAVSIIHFSLFLESNAQKLYLFSFISLQFYDVFFVIIKRFIECPGSFYEKIRRIVKPDQNHIHHLILSSGYHPYHSMLILVSFYFACLSITIIPIFVNGYYFLIFVIILVLNIAFRLFFENRLKSNG